jgi:hypothetical protein
MILQIDDLKLPPSIDETPYLTNRDTQRQTVSGRLITKLDPSEKWVVPVSFETDTLSPEFQAQFYSKCLEMRTEAKQVIFISPYSGEETTITAKCTSRNTPQGINIHQRRPQYYSKIGATFQEV